MDYNNNKNNNRTDFDDLEPIDLYNATDMTRGTLSMNNYTMDADSTYASQFSGWEQDLASSASYYQILSISLLGGFLVNFLTAKFFAPTINASNYSALLLIYVVCAIIGSVVINKGNSFAANIIGYALIVIPLGICMTPIVTLLYDPNIVATAFLGTAVITGGMVGMSFLFPDAFLSMGKILGASLLFSLIASIICSLLMPSSSRTLDFIILVIFALYIGYDTSKAREYPKTPQYAIRAAADLYLDIINIFLRLLRILAESKSRR